MGFRGKGKEKAASNVGADESGCERGHSQGNPAKALETSARLSAKVSSSAACLVLSF
jgi:hypothetical protein